MDGKMKAGNKNTTTCYVFSFLAFPQSSLYSYCDHVQDHHQILPVRYIVQRCQANLPVFGEYRVYTFKPGDLIPFLRTICILLRLFFLIVINPGKVWIIMYNVANQESELGSISLAQTCFLRGNCYFLSITYAPTLSVTFFLKLVAG